MRYGIYSAIAGALVGLAAAPSYASNCGSVPCYSRVTIKGNSVIPPPDEFRLRGDLFSSQFTDVALGADGSRQVNLGFNVNFGFGNVSTLYLNENGIISFLRPLGVLSGAPIANPALAAVGSSTIANQTLAAVGPSAANAFQPVTNLTDFGVPVIAPFYADLVQGRGAGDGQLGAGDITVQFGSADPYADGGAYSLRDVRQAVRITWYGLTTGSGANPVYAQLLLSSDLNGLSNFEFRYGPLSAPGQEGYGSIAGFALGPNNLQFSGPYRDGIETFFEFQNGLRINADTGAVPEPATWALFIAGFGLAGAALRARRRRVSWQPAPSYA